MKCINKRKLSGTLALLVAVCFLMSGCGQKEVIEGTYQVYQTTNEYGLAPDADTTSASAYFADNLCVTGTENIFTENVTESISQAAGLFNTQDNTVEFGKNVHERMYPASTTKILTAYVALKYGDLNAVGTVTEENLQLESGSTICGISVGDTVSLQELLYGLMLCSGNDAANVIADMISGSTEAFANLMNQEALALGATNSHFVNANGLHSEEHYTTVYDMYLIFNAALQNEQFLNLIGTLNHTANYANAQGEPVVKEWSTTNKYLKGDEAAPEGIQVLGGKTGTTSDAGYCLVLYSKRADAVPYISVIFKADSRDNLYYEMTELLEEILK